MVGKDACICEIHFETKIKHKMLFLTEYSEVIWTRAFLLFVHVFSFYLSECKLIVLHKPH